MASTEDFLSDIREIDDQHKRIVAQLDSIRTMAKNETEMSDLSDAVLELLRIAQHHIDAEESLMARLAYPNLEYHVQAHYAFRLTCETVQLELVKDRGTVEMLAESLLRWFEHHIQTEDAKYIAWYEHCQRPV